MEKYSFLFLVFLTTALLGQKKTDTLRLYFNINEVASEFNYQRLDSELTALNGKYADVAIYGYADFLHNPNYNQELSKKRAEKVKNYLIKKSKKSQFNFYACEGKGEVNSKENDSKEGEPFQRRVDVYFEPIVTLNVADEKLETPKDMIEPVVPKAKPIINKELTELNAGESAVLEGLGFQPGRHFILKESIPVLEKLLRTLQQNKTIKIEIQGHVCCTQNGEDGMDLDTKEMKLSENRAKSIYDFLIKKGIDTDRLSYKGFGRTQPKFPLELTPEEEQANRRVEIMIIKK